MDVWSDVLSQEQAERVVRDHGQTMKLIGYEVPDFTPADVSTRRSATPQQLFIPAEWKRWIAENLLLGQSRDKLVRMLVENGFPESLSGLEVDAADSHPYVTAARKLLSNTGLNVGDSPAMGKLDTPSHAKDIR